MPLPHVSGEDHTQNMMASRSHSRTPRIMAGGWSCSSLAKAQSLILAGAVTAAFCMPAVADLPVPRPVHEGDVTYLTAGIGLGERHALEAQAHNYNFEITNANKAGDSTSGTAFVIETNKGRDVLSVTGSGQQIVSQHRDRNCAGGLAKRETPRSVVI
jgi:hypothetical protein